MHSTPSYPSSAAARKASWKAPGRRCRGLGQHALALQRAQNSSVESVDPSTNSSEPKRIDRGTMVRPRSAASVGRQITGAIGYHPNPGHRNPPPRPPTGSSTGRSRQFVGTAVSLVESAMERRCRPRHAVGLTDRVPTAPSWPGPVVVGGVGPARPFGPPAPPGRAPAACVWRPGRPRTAAVADVGDQAPTTTASTTRTSSPKPDVGAGHVDGQHGGHGHDRRGDQHPLDRGGQLVAPETAHPPAQDRRGPARRPRV